MKVHVLQIPDEGMLLEGDEPPDLVAWPDFTAAGPVHYRVEATFRGGNLLVRGTLRIEGTSPCARCLHPLPVIVEVPDFTALIEKPEAECVDLTEQVREDILLALPAYVRCELDASKRCPITGESWNGEAGDRPTSIQADVWSALDKLGEEKEDKEEKDR